MRLASIQLLRSRQVPALAACSLLACSLLAACSSVPTTTVRGRDGGAIAIDVSGAGNPAVVLQSGLGDGKNTWAPIASTLSRSHRVFSYDRPGYGGSDATASPRDACSVARELHGALASANLAAPYLLVGHSLGGLYQYAFARLYPSEVAGIVLLDPTHPKHRQRMRAEAPAAAALVGGLRATVFSKPMRQEFDAQENCLQELERLASPGVPVRVLTRSRFDIAESGAFKTMVRSLEPDWRTLVGAERIEAVDGAGHYIHRDQPALVIAAIDAVAAQSRSRSK